MKKSTIIAILALIAGIILIVVGVAAIGGNFSKMNGKKNGGQYVSTTYKCSGAVTELSIGETYEGLRIETGNVDYPEITYWYDKNDADPMRISESGGKFSIERHQDDWNFKISFGFNTVDTSTVVTLPKNFDGEIDARCTSGSIKVSGIETGKNISLKANSGYVTVKETECDNLTLESHSGTIKFSDIKAKGDVKVTNTSGYINAENIKAKGDFSVSNTSGYLKVEDIECDTLFAGNSSGGLKATDVSAAAAEFKATSGHISLNKVEADSIKASCSSGGISIDDIKADAIDLSATSGSVHGDIDGKESDYSIVTSTTSGSCNLNGSRNGEKTLDVRTHSGSIRITFNK